MNGTYRVLSGKWSEEVAWLSLTYGLLVAAFLWINEFPDAAADEAAGKRTWVVRLGKARAAKVFAVIVGAAWLLYACALLLVLPWTEVLALAGVVPSVQAIHTLLRSWNSTRQLIPAQARTLAAFVLFAVGASLGMVIARSLAPAVPH
jgi:1,4-dihydroxy-2-naphthoate octaprenyltransferase